MPGKLRAVVAFDTSDLLPLDPRLAAVRQAVLGSGLDCDRGDCVALEDLPARLSMGEVAVVLGLSESGPGSRAARVASAARGVPVALVGPAEGPAGVLEAIRAGAREYLDESGLAEQLPAFLDRLNPTALAIQRGRAVAITSAAPGRGVSTVAVGLAVTLARLDREQVALAELGQGVPDLAWTLDVAPGRSLADLAARSDRADEIMLRRTLRDHPARLALLVQEAGSLTGLRLEPAAARRIILLARQMFAHSVLDLGASATPAALEAMRLAEVILVVTGLDVASLRLTRRYLEELETQAIPATRIALVANRFGQRNQVPWKLAEEAVGRGFLGWLPDDPGRVNAARNRGEPQTLVAWGSIMAKRLAHLARHCRINPRAAGTVAKGGRR